jgi:hypothetical protein
VTEKAEATGKPPLVVAVEAALGAPVLSLRYLPSAAAARAALAVKALPSGSPEDAAQVALDDLFDVRVAEPGVGGMLGSTQVDLPPHDEPAR